YTYLWSFLFKSFSVAQNTFLFHNFITGLILPLAAGIMANFFQGTVRDVGDGIVAVMRLCPQFALGYGLFSVGITVEWSGDDNDDDDFTGNSSALDLGAAGADLVYMGVCAVVYFVLLLFLER
ncbi:unnamed protein product, partial [Laminaria digitata]